MRVTNPLTRCHASTGILFSITTTNLEEFAKRTDGNGLESFVIGRNGDWKCGFRVNSHNLSMGCYWERRVVPVAGPRAVFLSPWAQSGDHKIMKGVGIRLLPRWEMNFFLSVIFTIWSVNFIRAIQCFLLVFPTIFRNIFVLWQLSWWSVSLIPRRSRSVQTICFRTSLISSCAIYLGNITVYIW